MPATKHPLATGMLGEIRVGHQLASGLRPLTSAVPVTYTIANSQHSATTRVTYTVLKGGSSTIQVYYTCTSTSVFSINGDGTIIAPDQVTYTPRPVVAHTLIAQPLLQGYRMMTWTYTVLQEFEAMHLLSFYNPVSPMVLLTYPDENGLWVQRQASMLPPNYGQQETVTVSGFSLVFLLLPN